MKRKIELVIDVPDTATEEEIEEFFMCEFNYNGECSCDNPFFYRYEYDVVDFVLL